MFLDKRYLYGIIALMVIFGLRGFLNNPNELLNLLLTIPGLLIAITFHEFAHAFTAYKLGDDTPRLQGRLTLNPLAHLDPIGSIMLLFAGFGWGKPVEVNPRNFDRRMSMDKANAVVSFAGPLMNFVLAFIFTLIYCAIFKFVGIINIYTSNVYKAIVAMVGYAISINVGLGIFNLIPVPPLDGSKIIKPFLPYNIRNWFENNETIFRIIFVVLWIANVLSLIISPVIKVILDGFLNLGFTIFGI